MSEQQIAEKIARKLEGKLRYECSEDCGWEGTDNIDALHEIDHLTQRVDPGYIMPAGACPACGALVDLHHEDMPVWLYARILQSLGWKVEGPAK